MTRYPAPIVAVPMLALATQSWLPIVLLVTPVRSGAPGVVAGWGTTNPGIYG